MRAYLTVTAALFTLVALAHLWRTVAESSRLTADPGFLIEGPGLGICAAALGIWAWSLLRKLKPDVPAR
jgi:hypothetical protein